jgi:NAD+ kinase
MLKKALLFINIYKTGAQVLADEINEELTRQGFLTDKLSLESEGSKVEVSALDLYDLAFSLGGDGTVLFTARALARFGTPIFPIHLGTLGFIASVRPEQWADTFKQWQAGKARLSRRLMLEVRVERDDKVVALGTCLNDIVISASGIAKLIRLKVEFGASLGLGEYRSDGLIVATPTGSTAYSMSAGGPILDPEMDALIINPICSFSLSSRPLVVPAGETIAIRVEPCQRSGVLLTLDGQATQSLEPNDRIYVKQASYRATFIASDRSVFYEALRAKLSWSGSAGGARKADDGGGHA